MNLENKILIDGHCDTLCLAYEENCSIANTAYSFNLEDANIIKPYIQVLASYIKPKDNNGYNTVNKLLDKYYEEYDKYKDHIITIKDLNNIEQVANENKVGIILSTENGDAINGSIENLVALYNRGMRIMSLTWNADNLLACGAHTLDDTGLTPLGIEVIHKMNELNMIIDVSHASPKSFYDIARHSDLPIIATHSCCSSICKSKRNLTDDQIKKIAESGGVIGVCFCSEFLNNANKSTSDDIVRHIEYIANLVGVEHVAIGSDFDGMDVEDLPTDIKGIKDLYIIFDKLQQRGFLDEDIYKIAGDNYIRVFKSFF